MNYVETIANYRDLLQSLDKPKVKTKLKEAKGHMDHPEDLVFLQGQFGTDRAIQAILDTVKNPKSITIKWDGYPAIIWGYGPDGKFSVMDKHMFNKGSDSPAREVHSPQEFISYDRERGVDRTGLHEILQQIWPDLQAVTPKKQGYFWGDLLFNRPLQSQQDGLYRFQANPKGITYTVDSNSEIGEKFFKGKNAGIVVHQFLPVDSESTDDAESLNGTTGGLGQSKGLSILSAQMPITPKLKVNKNLVQKAYNSATQYGKELDEFFSTPPQSVDAFTNLFTTYINKRIVSKDLKNLTDGFLDFVANRPLTEPMRKKLLGYTDPQTNQHTPGYLDGNYETLKHIFQIWTDIYNLKMDIVPQLDKAAENAPVQGYLQDGTRTQEGFVSQGLKLVNRMGFSAQNLAGRT